MTQAQESAIAEYHKQLLPNIDRIDFYSRNNAVRLIEIAVLNKAMLSEAHFEHLLIAAARIDSLAAEKAKLSMLPS